MLRALKGQPTNSGLPRRRSGLAGMVEQGVDERYWAGLSTPFS
jgi:hypothetical protein